MGVRETRIEIPLLIELFYLILGSVMIIATREFGWGCTAAKR